MKTHDIVYFVKPDLINNELVYSLRSIEANFQAGRVWFCGGQPIGLIPDARMAIPQHGRNRYERVRNMLLEVCENDEITEDFWLFNDDFFILQKIEGLAPWYNGDLYRHVIHVERRHGNRPSDYTNQLRKTITALEEKGLGCLNYAVHAPMLINRQKMIETIAHFPDVPMFRALYGNHHKVGGFDAPDVKIVRPEIEIPEGAAYVSTSDASFINGKVGQQLRNRFPEKSRWEVK